MSPEAWVPVDDLEEFKTGMEALLGAGKCHVLHIRPQGGCVGPGSEAAHEPGVEQVPVDHGVLRQHPPPVGVVQKGQCHVLHIRPQGGCVVAE